MARRFGRIVLFPLAALASCYLGLLIAQLLWQAPQLLVAAVSDATIVGFGRFGSLNPIPRLYVLPPSDASPLLFALYAAGAVVTAALLLTTCVPLAAALRGWLRLGMVYLGFWTALLLASAAMGFGARGGGPLAPLVGMATGAVGNPGGGAMLGWAGLAGRWVLAAAVGFACWFGVTRLLQALLGESGDSAERGRRLLLWFVLPAAAVIIAAPGAIWRFGRFEPLDSLFAVSLVPALLAGVPALTAIRFRRGQPRPFQPTLRGAVGTAAAGGLALAAMAAYPSLVRAPKQPEFDQVASRHWEIGFERGAFSAGERQSWAAAADERLEEYSRRLGIRLDETRLRSRVYLSTSSKRAATHERRDDAPFTLDADALTLDQLLAPDKTPQDARGEPLLLMANAWGAPASREVAEAVARYAVGGFLDRGLAAYARRIGCQERPYTLTEILGIDAHYLSPLVRDALGGAWVESLVEHRSVAVLPRVYGAIPAEEGAATIAGVLGSHWDELESGWQAFLAKQAEPETRANAGPRAGSPRAPGAEPCEPPQPVPSAATLQRGISFSHELGGDWGYGSDNAQRELEKIRAIGANSVAIMPYAFTRAPEETSIRFRTDETDARVIRSIEQARRAGLHVMLKPHLWGRGFTGDIRFASDQDFGAWWQSYRSWMLHFARLAELYDVELLALGNELGGLTVHEQAWRDLIRDVRRVYGGKLTYASHWSGEFEQVAFWDALDSIGVNAYFPLAGPGEAPKSDSARVAAIRARLAAVAARFGKPVLFTEVGFPSTENAAVEPWSDRRGAIDLQMQKECYEVVFESFSGEPWFAGAYWWKWPSHGRGGPYDGSHAPNGKPAMEVLRRWFRREAGG